jgi:fibrillarin-like pre-rRNA processing protein
MLNVAPEKVFPGVFRIEVDSRAVLATKNMTPGRKVYGEQLIDLEGIEYRTWSPYRSKLAAAVLKGLTEFPISIGDKVLYLGVASGTTCSHVSDVVGPKGYIWGVDFAPRSLRDLVSNVARYRQNISPILGDARDPASYSAEVQRVDVLYADVAQPAQAELVVRNAEMFLREGGRLAMAIKSRSVNVTRSPRDVYSDQIGVLEGGGFTIGEMLELEPYEKDHAMVTAAYRA